MHAYQKTMTAKMIRDGYTVCGQHVVLDDPNSGKWTIDFDKMMAQCFTDINRSDLKNMFDQTEKLTDFILERGTVSWEEMDAAGIPTSDTSIKRDWLTHIRHWSEVVTHPAVQHKLRGVAVTPMMILIMEE